MTRFRAPGGTATTMTSMPPPDALPDSVGKVLAELSRLKVEHERASNEDNNLRVNAHEDNHRSRHADAQAAAEAARSGKDPGATPNMDELRARRNRAEQETAALAGAIDLIVSDLWQAKEDYIATGQPAEDVKKARANLAKAGAAFQAALTAALQAAATEEWLRGQAYDARPLLPIVDLAVDSRDVVGRRVNDFPPIDVVGSIKAISTMVD